jgi:hypothetical protein
MKIAFRAALVGAAAAVAVGMGTNLAQATPPVPTPEPGGIIRYDLAPGEWWGCDGLSLAPPFIQISPYVLGPNPIYLRFAPNTDVWVRCSGTGLPIQWYGPIVRTGN